MKREFLLLLLALWFMFMLGWLVGCLHKNLNTSQLHLAMLCPQTKCII